MVERFGVREAGWDLVGNEHAFFINGRRLFLRGLNRHQTWPFFGCAAAARLQRDDADIIRFRLRCNVVRTSHYPQSKHFLDRCDEIGLLVIEEMPGWQHIGNAEWQDTSCVSLQRMIERDRNHPAIILWGVRINESRDDDPFYLRTNALSRLLDPTRPTGGIRGDRHFASHFLEDVFTYNDFSNAVAAPPSRRANLITENNGHMFPTKSIDGEERRMEHALRHARVHGLARARCNISGVLSWCFADYATHWNFGAGDRICYHGVLDIFRNDKWAAFFYASQTGDAADEDEDDRAGGGNAGSIAPYVRLASLWSVGDRSEGHNNPAVIFTNCDYVIVEQDGRPRQERFFPSTAPEYAALRHPPVFLTFTESWERPSRRLVVVGYKHNKAVASHTVLANGLVRSIACRLDSSSLFSDGSDATRLSFELVDEAGNRKPYASDALRIVVSDNNNNNNDSKNKSALVDVIGCGESNLFSLVGGCGAVWLRSRSHSSVGGVVTITVSSIHHHRTVAPVTLTLAMIPPSYRSK